MQIAVVKDELKKVYEKIGEYELLGINEVNGRERRTFYSDGIVIFHKNYRDIGFSRTFADTIVPESFIDEVIVDNNTIMIRCGKVKYFIFLIKQKVHLTDTSLLPSTIHIDTLIDSSYFDAERIMVKHNVVRTPLDLKKLGILTLRQRTAIKRIIENELNGSQAEFQCCRVPAFSVEFHDNEYVICGHIYDYAEKHYLNRVELYKSSEDLNGINPYKAYLEYVDGFRR